jgi:hypothetical protein
MVLTLLEKSKRSIFDCNPDFTFRFENSTRPMSMTQGMEIIEVERKWVTFNQIVLYPNKKVFYKKYRHQSEINIDNFIVTLC